MKYTICFSFILLLIFGISNHGKSQQTPTIYCNYNQAIYDQLANDPSFQLKLDSVKAIQDQHALNVSQQTNRATVYYIPVVYHILHEGGIENITDAQVKSDLEQLNNMFNKLNSSVSSVHPTFRARAADVEIEFILAQKKNDGTCFSGITRTFSSLTNHTGNSSGVANAVRAAHGDFPGNKYMNIFVSKTIGGAAGYTTQPWFTGMENGIFILHNYVGTIGTSQFPNENATTAHEAGHWLNLDHPWGGSNNPGLSSNCSSDDGITDTPNTIGWTSCNVNGSTCGSLDNVENIMDYSYCPNHMFTNGQSNKMRAAATSPIGGRSNVTSAANHAATGIFSDVLCKADFSSDQLVVCDNDPVQFFDDSYHNATSWNWTFQGGTPSTSTAKNPTVTYAINGSFDVTLKVTNASGNITVTKNNYMRVLGYYGKLPPFTRGFEDTLGFDYWWNTNTNANNDWQHTNSASYSGSRSVYINNFDNEVGTVSELSSNTVNLLGMSSASLSYRYAYARKSSTGAESVQLLFSKDCGKTWVIARALIPSSSTTNSPFVPSGNSDWNYHTVNISSSYFEPNFRYMFKVTNNGGNNIYIDDININSVVSINEIEEVANINIYPNPFNESATIDFQLKSAANVSIVLIDMVGKEVETILPTTSLTEHNNHSYMIQKNALTNGVYFVKMNVNGKTSLKKIVIQ